VAFQKIEKYSGGAELNGAIVKVGKDKKTVYITLGQDVVKRYDLQGVKWMEVHVGSDRDAGKLLLVPSSKHNGYCLQIDDYGKGKMSLIKPSLVSAFCNGHSKIECTVSPYTDHGIVLIGNGRGR
jgi:hypothetical protein